MNMYIYLTGSEVIVEGTSALLLAFVFIYNGGRIAITDVSSPDDYCVQSKIYHYITSVLHKYAIS